MDLHTFFARLDRLYAAGDRKNTESFLQQSLQEARREDGPADITVLNELMGFYRNTGQVEKSILYMEQALERTRAAGRTESAEWGTTLLNAATACRVAGDEGRALELYREAEKVYLRYLPEGDPRLAAVYNNMSGVYAAKGDRTAAAGLLLRALDVMANREDTAIEQAVMRTNLAHMYFGMGRDREAMAELEAALSIYEKHPEPDGKTDPHYASALAALAVGRYRKGRYEETARLCEQAMEEIQAHYGRNQDYYVTCRNCAQAYRAMGDEDKAAQYLSIAESSPAKDGSRS